MPPTPFIDELASMAANISANDKLLIDELRSALKDDLELVPGYDDDLSLLRWLVGWDRRVDVVVPKLSQALQTVNALGLQNEDFTSLEAVKNYCDNISKPACYMPGSLIGHDKDGNVISLQCLGVIDGTGLLRSTMISDLYLMRIAESEGVMQLIRDSEQQTGRQYGTCVIIDLDGISMDSIDWAAIKVITGMLSKLQELFPDVLRKLYVIRAPSFIQLLWAAISPCLAKQTQQKIEFLGGDWKEKLRANIDPSTLYEHWGGTRPSDTPSGDVRMGGKVPKDLYYDPALDATAQRKDLIKLNVPARGSTFVPILVEGGVNPRRKLRWWWKCDSGDLDFAVRRAPCGVETASKAEEEGDAVCWPKWRLLTEFVPDSRAIKIPAPGLYKLTFDNSHGKLWSKTVKYYVTIEED
uniref:CRAL-TRIO domain-containing protein n=1 Tax=Panagrellus redivivus TaxID=6233 RepID=A0A7E4VJQ0_PANRE